MRRAGQRDDVRHSVNRRIRRRGAATGRHSVVRAQNRNGRQAKNRRPHRLSARWRRSRRGRPMAILRGERWRPDESWHLRGFRDGAAWRAAHPDAAAEDMREALQSHLRTAFPPAAPPSALRGASGAERILRAARRYGDGFMNGAALSAPVVPVPLQGTAAAVVCAGPDEGALRAVLEQLERLPLREWVVVLFGDARPASDVAGRFARSVIVHAEGPPNRDVGLALGAGRTRADIVLFVDGEQPVPAETLARFLLACDRRLDVALNSRLSEAVKFHRRSQTDWLHQFLNLTLGRPDLGIRSLAVLPFALSRKALDVIGADALAVPVKAHARAILHGLHIGSGGSIPRRETFDANRLRLVAGDYLETWREAMAERGGRLTFPDRWRNRDAAGGTIP